GYLVGPAEGQPSLVRMACKENGVWKLIDVQRAGDSLRASKATGDWISHDRLECVTENTVGAVAYVSLPWAAENLKGPAFAAIICLPVLALLGSLVLLKRFERAVKNTL